MSPMINANIPKIIRREEESLFPKSRRIFVRGQRHPDVLVPMREVELSPTNHADGRVEENEPVRIYDPSGPWGDPEFKGSVETGLPAVRRDWILARGDVEEYDGRDASPEDNGYLSAEHAERFNEKKAEVNRLKEYPGLSRRPLRSTGKPVSQLWYARQGIVTPEMEYIAIRENLGRDATFESAAAGAQKRSQSATSRAEFRRGDSRAHHARIRPR